MVAVVEDNGDIVTLLGLWLESHGATVVAVPPDDDALDPATWTRLAPACVVSDWLLDLDRDVTGDRVLAAVAEGAPGARRVLLTGSVRMTECETADVVVRKPCDPDTLAAHCGLVP